MRKKPNVKTCKSAPHDFDTLHASLAWRIIAYRRGIIKFELQSIINRFRICFIASPTIDKYKFVTGHWKKPGQFINKQ